MASAIKAIERPAPAADEWMNVQEAADALGITRYLLLKRAAHGEFATTTVAKRLVISRASVERALAGQGA